MIEVEYLPDFKICSKCKKKKSNIEFNLHRGHTDGLTSTCRECMCTYDGVYHRNHNYLYRHGITNKQYEQMLEAQNSVCAICGRPETVIRYGKIQPLCIDHDHKTGKNRALLCFYYNTTLGKIEKTSEGIQVYLDYLRESYPLKIQLD